MPSGRQANQTRTLAKDVDWLEEKLLVVSRNLLQRPTSRRGPFVISDRELEAPRIPRSARLANSSS